MAVAGAMAAGAVMAVAGAMAAGAVMAVSSSESSLFIVSCACAFSKFSLVCLKLFSAWRTRILCLLKSTVK
jgi:hypothetical protein